MNDVPMVSVLRSLQELEPIADEWNTLADRAGNPLLRHEWFASCAQTLTPAGQLSVITAKRDGRLVGVAPLSLVDGPGGPRLEFLGMAALYEPSGFLFADESVFDALCVAIGRLGVPVMLRRLSVDSPVPAGLQRALPWPGRVFTRPEAPSLFVPVRGDWAVYYAGLSSSITGNLRRLKKRAGRLGTAVVEVLSPDEADVDRLLECFVDIEASGWKSTARSALRQKTELRAFFGAYARRAARLGLLRVAILRLGAQVAAAELAVEAYRRWWQLKIGYLHELASFYPGLQLTEATIRHAFERGLLSYEFLGVAGDWERRWNAEPRHYRTAAVYPRSLKGAQALAADGLQVAGRAVRRLAGQS